MTEKQTVFLIKAKNFKASNVVIGDTLENASDKPHLSVKYRYPTGEIGPLRIQMNNVTVALNSMRGDKANRDDKGKDLSIGGPNVTNESCDIKFSIDEQYTVFEKKFVEEYIKFENLSKEAVKKIAHLTKLGVNVKDDDTRREIILDSKQYRNLSINMDKKQTHTYTTLKTKMYKKDENNGVFYSFKFEDINKTKVVLTPENIRDYFINYSSVTCILTCSQIWISPNKFGPRLVCDKMAITKLPDNYGDAEFLSESEDDGENKVVGNDEIEETDISIEKELDELAVDDDIEEDSDTEPAPPVVTSRRRKT